VRVLVGNGRAYRALRFFTFPVRAGLLFNLGIVVSHIPGVVNASVSNGPLHYFVHVILVIDINFDVDASLRTAERISNHSDVKDDLPFLEQCGCHHSCRLV